MADWTDDDLIQKFLDRAMTPSELEGLNRRLVADDAFARRFAEATRVESFLQTSLKEFRAPASGSENGPQPRTTRRSVRTPRRGRQQFPWILVWAAAAILVGLALLMTFSGGESTEKPDTVRRREVKRPGREEPEERRAPAQTEPPKTEQKREESSRPPEEPAKEQRKKPLEEVQREKERIEQELRDAARPKTAPEPPQDPPKPAPPQEKKIEATATVLATIEQVDGDVILVRASGRLPAQAGQALLPGDGMITPKTKSGVVVKHADGTRMDVGYDTELKDLSWEGGKRLFLLRGELRAVVAKQPNDQPMIFATPHGEAKVLGTTLRLLVDKETRLDVEEGKVRMSNLAGKTVDVASGHFTVAAVGGDLASRPISSGTVYSPIRYVGDLANWEVFPPDVWKVVSRDGDARFFKKPSLEPIEMAKLKDRTYGDFTLTFKAKTVPYNGGNIPNGYTILFGMQGDSTWCVLTMTTQAETTRIEGRLTGRKLVIPSALKPGCPDFTRYHAVTVVRKKDTVTVTVNGELILTATDRDLVGVGQIGLGAGGAYFDDILIE